MSRTRLLTWFAAIALAVSLASSAQAQKILPFIEPDAFNPDYQFFAPAEVGEYDQGVPPNTGYFFTYERLYLNMSRPELEASFNSFFKGDWTWGNRYEFGYMTEDQKGWLFSVMHVDGPNETFPALQESLNRFVRAPGAAAATPLIPEFQALDYSLLKLQDSINVADYSHVTIERVWRRDPLHNGANVEGTVGMRIMRFNDYYQRDSFPLGSSFGRYSDTVDNFPNLVDPDGEGPWEVFDHRVTKTENFMLGGQFGIRYSQKAGHWTTAIEVRAFGAQNWVNQTTIRDRYNVRWASIGDDTTPGDGPDLVLTERQNPVYDRASEFAFGGEVRGKASYAITRDIELNCGFAFLDLGKGIARGANLDRSHQDVQMASVDFGVMVNR